GGSSFEASGVGRGGRGVLPRPGGDLAADEAVAAVTGVAVHVLAGDVDHGVVAEVETGGEGELGGGAVEDPEGHHARDVGAEQPDLEVAVAGVRKVVELDPKPLAAGGLDDRDRAADARVREGGEGAAGDDVTALLA